MPKINTHRCLQAQTKQDTRVAKGKGSGTPPRKEEARKTATQENPSPEFQFQFCEHEGVTVIISHGGIKSAELTCLKVSLVPAVILPSHIFSQSSMRGFETGMNREQICISGGKKGLFGQTQISCRPLSSKQHATPCVQNLSRILQKWFLFLESYSAESV